MKKFTLIAIASLVGSVPVLASDLSHPCEIVFNEILKESKKYTPDDYKACVSQFGKTSALKEAEKYNEKLAKRKDEIEKELEKRKKSKESERSKVIVDQLDAEAILSHKRNFMKLHYAASVTKYNNGSDDYEISADDICKKLGYEKSLAYTVSKKFDDFNKEDREKAPRVLFIEKGFFGGEKPVVLDAKEFNTREYGVAFSYYTSLTCQRDKTKDEETQEFEIDMDKLLKEVEASIKAPELSDEAAAILNISRKKSEGEVKTGDRSDDGRVEKSKVNRSNLYLYGRSRIE